MVDINNFWRTSLCVLGLSMLAACSSQMDMPEEIIEDGNGNQVHTCKLEMNVTKSGFDDEPQTRSAAVWENGDKIYLTFSTAEGTSYGDAIYKDGTWNVSYYGSLTADVQTNCTAVYFDNPEFESSSVVKITEDTGIYEDANGSYVFNGGTLSVTANLKPKTGRIRFVGTNDDEITLYGISHYTSYDCSTGKYTNSIGALKKTVSDGYTPYVYGEFSDADQPRLNIITSNSGYTKLLPTSIYQAAQSGYMNIPTETAHNGWQNSVVFKVNGVEFSMIPVVQEDSSFLLAETLTTVQLYNAVMGEEVSNSQFPKNGLSSWDSFISKLSAITELDFRSPTKEEWQFAAKGGNQTQGYAYAGSNIISNVAWYMGNSENKIHEVKLLQPNELGFYDMSGNLWELTSTIYAGDYVWCGGCYNSSESNCTITSTTTYSSSGFNYSKGGFRLALSNK